MRRPLLLLLALSLGLLLGCSRGSSTGDRPAGSALYVSGLQNHVLLRVNPRTQKLLGDPLPLPEGPSGMASGAGMVYVALLGRDYLEELGAASGTESRRLTVGCPTAQVALSPDGSTLAASCFEEGQVVLLDRATGAERERVAVGGQPWDVEWDPGGARLYVSNYKTGQVHLLEPGHGVVRSINVGVRPRGLAVEGSRVAVALSGEDRLATFDVQAPEAEVRTMVVGRSPYDVLLTGGGAVVSLFEGSGLAFVDFASDGAVPMETGEGPAGMALDPAGQFLYVACEGASEIFILGLHDNSEVGRIKLPEGFRPREVVFSR